MIGRKRRGLGAAGLLLALREGPEEFRARIRRDHARFRDIVRAANLQPE